MSRRLRRLTAGHHGAFTLPWVSGAGDLLPAGGKVRGLNLGPSPAQWEAGAYTFQMIWAHWDQGWINACLDDAVEFGCNVVRQFGALTGIMWGVYTRAEYLALWDQLYDAATARGLHLYPCNDGVDAFQTYADLETEMVAFAAHINSWPFRPIGIDIIQEQPAFGVSASGIALAAAVRAVTSLPLTYSNNAPASGPAGDMSTSAFQTLLAGLDPIVDFHDAHWYFDPPATELETYYWGHGYTKPILIGEFGSSQAEGSGANASRYSSVAAVMNHSYSRRPAGALAWLARDWSTTDTSNEWGLSSSSGVRRSGMVTTFETIPKT